MAELHSLLTGLAMGESPRWHNGRLWLADWGASEILVVDGGGARKHIASAPSVPCSIDWLPNEEMLVVSVAARDSDTPNTISAELIGQVFNPSPAVGAQYGARFTLGGARYQLGKPGDHFEITVQGHLNGQAPPSGYMAGFVTGLELQPIGK